VCIGIYLIKLFKMKENELLKRLQPNQSGVPYPFISLNLEKFNSQMYEIIFEIHENIYNFLSSEALIDNINYRVILKFIDKEGNDKLFYEFANLLTEEGGGEDLLQKTGTSYLLSKTIIMNMEHIHEERDDVHTIDFSCVYVCFLATSEYF